MCPSVHASILNSMWYKFSILFWADSVDSMHIEMQGYTKDYRNIPEQLNPLIWRSKVCNYFQEKAQLK